MSSVDKSKEPNGNKLQPSDERAQEQQLLIQNGWLQKSEHQPSNFFSLREPQDDISLLVIHNISLPAGCFGNNHITELFLGKLNTNDHPSFCDLNGLEVSAHCLIKRDGKIIQYVSFNDKAWHAGVSCFNGRDKCNDFSIGIELEGTDDIPYEAVQYQQLTRLAASLQKKYPKITNENIVGHCDIAPIRKTDPGKVFNWFHFRELLQQAT